MIEGFSHVQLVVRDVAVSAPWYRAVLGLEEFVSGTLPSGPYVGLRHPGAGFVVGLQTAAPGEPTGPGMIEHLSFAVADEATLRRVHARLRADGFAVGEPFEERVSHNLRVTDPDGLTVELTAPKR